MQQYFNVGKKPFYFKKAKNHKKLFKQKTLFKHGQEENCPNLKLRKYEKFNDIGRK